MKMTTKTVADEASNCPEGGDDRHYSEEKWLPWKIEPVNQSRVELHSKQSAERKRSELKKLTQCVEVKQVEFAEVTELVKQNGIRSNTN
jgi:hypothetical protein